MSIENQCKPVTNITIDWYEARLLLPILASALSSTLSEFQCGHHEKDKFILQRLSCLADLLVSISLEISPLNP